MNRLCLALLLLALLAAAGLEEESRPASGPLKGHRPVLG